MAVVGGADVVTIRCDIGIAADCGADFNIEGRLTYGRPEAYWRHVDTAHPLACPWVRGRFPAYAEGSGLDTIADERICRHLGSCEHCQKALLCFLHQTSSAGRTLRIVGGQRPPSED